MLQCSGQWVAFSLHLTWSTVIRDDISSTGSGPSVCSTAGYCGRTLQWDRKPERKLLISFLQLEGIIVTICRLVSSLLAQEREGIAASHLPARRKLSCLFHYGKVRCFVPAQRRPERIRELQLPMKCNCRDQVSRLERFSCSTRICSAADRGQSLVARLRKGR